MHLSRKSCITTIMYFLILATSFCFALSASAIENIYQSYFVKRIHIKNLIADSRWISRYSVNANSEVMGTAFNNQVNAFFRFEGRLKPGLKGDLGDSVVSLSSYADVKVTFSDEKGNVFSFDLFSPADNFGGSYTHNTYRQMLSFFDLYHYEVNNKKCPYKYARYIEDPQILQAARLLVKKKSDFIIRLENRIQFPFGFTSTSSNQGRKVQLVLENSPAWFAGLRENDLIADAVVDYTRIPLKDFNSEMKKEVSILQLLIYRTNSDGASETKILTMYRDTVLESRLFDPPK